MHISEGVLSGSVLSSGGVLAAAGTAVDGLRIHGDRRIRGGKLLRRLEAGARGRGPEQ